MSVRACKRKLAALSGGTAAAISACAATPPVAAGPDRVESALVDRSGRTLGTVAIREGPHGVLIRIDAQGLPEGWRGAHLHEVGTCADPAAGFKASGGHINPDGRAHGLLNPAGDHRADLQNIHAGTDGRMAAEFFRRGVSLSSRADGRIALLDEDGVALIIHTDPDDHMTQPIGGAGPRLACAAFNGGE